MKKLFSVLLAVALVLSIGATSAFAASDTRGVNFVDANSDGVCDVCGGVDADGNGICDSCPNGGVRPQDGSGRRAGRGNAGQGAGFVDADGDGICDNCLNGGVRAQDGTGAQRGRMGGRNK